MGGGGFAPTEAHQANREHPSEEGKLNEPKCSNREERGFIAVAPEEARTIGAKNQKTSPRVMEWDAMLATATELREKMN